MSIALRQSQMDIFGFISLFPSELFHEAMWVGRRRDGRRRVVQAGPGQLDLLQLGVTIATVQNPTLRSAGPEAIRQCPT